MRLVKALLKSCIRPTQGTFASGTRPLLHFNDVAEISRICFRAKGIGTKSIKLALALLSFFAVSLLNITTCSSVKLARMKRSLIIRSFIRNVIDSSE